MHANRREWPVTVLDDLPLLWQVVSHVDGREHVMRDGLGFKHARDLVKFFRYAAGEDVMLTMRPMGAMGQA